MSAREAKIHFGRCFDAAASLDTLSMLIECSDPDLLEERDPEALRNVGRMVRVLSDSLFLSLESAQVAVGQMPAEQP